MRTGKRSSMLLAGIVVGVLALSGCGSSATKTVSVSSSPVPASTGTTDTRKTTSTSTTPTATSTTSTGTSTSGGSSAETTRTTTAPAFTKQSGNDSEGLDGAVAAVKAHGYTTAGTSDYHSGQTLRVLVGTRSGSGDGYGQRAFFFVDGHYIGTDASEPSASVKVVAQSDTEVTLAYPLYRAHDPLCCPGGGQATVHFQLNNGRLVALNPIPPASSQTGLSRG